jgi:hypothetical protein
VVDGCNTRLSFRNIDDASAPSTQAVHIPLQYST